MNKPNRYRVLAFLLTIAIGFSLWQWIDGRAQNDANCSAPYQIDEQLPNGGRWELCWEHRTRDGIVLRDLYYTTPKGIRRRVLAEAGIAQVHVPYDDNSARFHDITDDGFGDRNLANLLAAECPDGTLLPFEGKNVLCQQIAPRGYAWRSADDHQQGYSLNLFSVSTSGEYNYIPEWRFWDDGTIQPLMGASGKLQRFDTGGPHSWPIRANGISGISHIHNYYWRLDFDLGESGTDDLVEELDIVAAESGAGRRLVTTPLEIETSRSAEPELMRSWRIRDGDQASGYQLDPRSLSHRDVGPSFEPWTHHDLFVTKYNECELYVSHNPAFGGCATQVADFVNGESLAGADLVLWYGVTFHHVPRDEDEPHMHTHWDGFQISPINWMAANELYPEPTPTLTAEPTPTLMPEPTIETPPDNSPPVARFIVFPITGTGSLTGSLTVPITVTLDGSSSTDVDGQIVGYEWDFEMGSKVGSGVGDASIARGITVTHLYTVAGLYPITLTVTDDGGLTGQASQTLTLTVPITEPVFSQCQLGDVNCDSTVNIVDALFILQHVQGTRTLIDTVPDAAPDTVIGNPADNEMPLPAGTLFGPACDVEMDGNCDLKDALTIFECSTAVANQFCPVPGQATASMAEVQLFEKLLKRLNDLYLPLIH